MASSSGSRWALTYDDHRKAQHHAHVTILRGLGQKWAKIVYKWGPPADDEARHLEHLKHHKVV